MPTIHTVQQGECLANIAVRYGLTEKKIWNYGENSALKNKRKDPNVLFPGDELKIPEITLKEVSKGTGQRHNFVKKGVPAKLQVRLMSDGDPRGNEKYTLEIDGGVPIEGSTDGDGWIRKKVAPTAQVARLSLKNGNEVYHLNLGHLDPLDEVSGIKARLNGLGYKCGEVNDEWDEASTAALKKFQYDQQMEEKGDWKDQPTKDKLKEVFGS